MRVPRRPASSPAHLPRAAPASRRFRRRRPRSRSLSKRRRAVARRGRPSGAAEMPHLDREKRGARLGACSLDDRVDRLRRRPGRAAARRRHPAPRAGGSMCSVLSSRAGMTPVRVHRRPERAKRCERRVRLPRARPSVHRLDERERVPAQRLRHLGERREAHDAAARASPSSGTVSVHSSQALEHLLRPLDREEEDARVHLGDREEPQLDRGHDREAAAAAADRPEELRVVVRVDAADTAVGVDDLGREDRVRGEAVLAGEPAEAAAERVAENADVVRRAGERGEAVLGSPVRA